jgi:hypothetical protein
VELLQRTWPVNHSTSLNPYPRARHFVRRGLGRIRERPYRVESSRSFQSVRRSSRI